MSSHSLQYLPLNSCCHKKNMSMVLASSLPFELLHNWSCVVSTSRAIHPLFAILSSRIVLSLKKKKWTVLASSVIWFYKQYLIIGIMMLIHRREALGYPRYENRIILEMWGIDPHASRMRSERSTIWATSPLDCNRYFVPLLWLQGIVTYAMLAIDTGKQNVGKKKLQHTLFHRSTTCKMTGDARCQHDTIIEMRGIDPRTSRMIRKRA